MTLESTNNQEHVPGSEQSHPFDPNDKERAAQLEAKFGPKLTNEYVVNGVTVKIGSGGAVINKVPDGTPEGFTNIGKKREEYTIELPVTIIDPNASGDFKNTGRWSKYVLQVDKNTGEVMWSSRVDRSFDEKQQKYSFDGPRYQIHQPEVEALLNTQIVKEAMDRIQGK